MTGDTDSFRTALAAALRRGFQYALGLLGITGVAALLYASLSARLSIVGAFEATVRFFSYFTIQSGLAAIAWTLVQAARSPTRTPNPSRGADLGALLHLAFLTSSILTAGGYYALLHDRSAPQGLHAFGDLLLHAVVPAMLVLDWILFAPKGRFQASWIPVVLALPLLHLGLTAALHGWLGTYPYYFLDPTRLGVPAFLRNVGVFAAIFLIVGALLVLADRLVARIGRSVSKKKEVPPAC